jgi:hypothetical protein
VCCVMEVNDYEVLDLDWILKLKTGSSENGIKGKPL